MSIRKFCRNISKNISEIKDESVMSYLGRSRLSLVSNTELVAEGYITIEIYENEKIAFSTQDVSVTVYGRGLDMCFLKPTAARIKGYITDIELGRVRERVK